ncbi:MAG: rhomboid family intramembrane serine protease [Haloferacaceae archaeon]
MADRAGFPGRELLRAYPERLRTRAAATDWQVTLALVGLTAVAYLGQTLAAIRVGAPVRDVTAFLFLARPALAWPLSPFLHAGPLHFVANVAVLVPTGIEAERHLSRRQYVGLFLVSSAGASLVAAATTMPFAEGPVAAYGISGFVFALATYLLVHLALAHEAPILPPDGPAPDRHPLEIVAVLLGVSVLVLVAADVGGALLNGFRGVNGGHLGGAFVGIVVGGLHRTSCHGAFGGAP